MEIRVKVQVENDEEMSECFRFDEVLNIRFCEKIGDGLYMAVIRLPECEINFRGVTTLKNIKQRVVEARSDLYPIKSKVTFLNETEHIIYAGNEFWENEYIERCAELNNSKVIKVERLEG